jgi:hypothetical protein
MLRRIAQFEELAGQNDRLLEVDGWCPFAVGTQTHTPHALSVALVPLPFASLCHRLNATGSPIEVEDEIRQSQHT